MKEEYDEGLARRLGEMHTQFSGQYNVPCVVPCIEKNADKVIDHCKKMGAIFNEGEDDCYVVVLRLDVGAELWTEQSLRRSLK